MQARWRLCKIPSVFCDVSARHESARSTGTLEFLPEHDVRIHDDKFAAGAPDHLVEPLPVLDPLVHRDEAGTGSHGEGLNIGHTEVAGVVPPRRPPSGIPCGSSSA